MTHVFPALFLFFLCLAAEWSIGRAALLHSGLAEGLCQFQNQFKDTQKMFSKLEEHNVTPKIPVSWLRWRKCDNKQCTPFTTHERNTKMERSIIIELRHAPDCYGHEISCVDPTNCPGNTKSNSRSSSIPQYLQEHAKTTQASILQTLHSESKSSLTNITIEPLWITNIIIVRGTDLLSVKQMLKNHKDVKTIRMEQEFLQMKHTGVNATTELPPNSIKSTRRKDALHWGPEELNVEELHQQGIAGENTVVGLIGNGPDYTNSYIGPNWRTNYGWFDPFNMSQFPKDTLGFDTACIGIMVANGRIGVAPKAKWIACKACENLSCTEVSILKCFQWMLCPTKADGTDPDCSKKPDVVMNAWSYGPKDDHNGFLDGMLECWLHASIVPAFAVGNFGPNCTSCSYPASSTKAIGVGIVTLVSYNGDVRTQVLSQSSRGPAYLRDDVIKPDFAAPGAAILAPGLGNTMQHWSGSIFATSFLAGTVALMRSVNSSLSVNDIIGNLRLSTRTTRPVGNGLKCGNIDESVYPNNNVGYGIINSYKAVLLKDP